MKFLFTFITLTSLSSNASIWVYSDQKDLMTDNRIYKAEIHQEDITAKFQCSYPDGAYMGIYTRLNGLSSSSGQLGLRYKIDNSDVFTDNISAFQKEGISYFQIPNSLLFKSLDHLVNGKLLKIEVADSFEDKIYREISLENSSQALYAAISKCGADFEETDKKPKKITNSTKEEALKVQSLLSLISDRITAAWIRPPSARNNMKTQLRIYFLPNGEVINAQILQSSGDSLFDQRAIDAVYKIRKIEEISKLDSYVFERDFHQIDLIFNPMNVEN